MRVFGRKGFWLLLLVQSPLLYALFPYIWKNGFDPLICSLCFGMPFASFAIFWLDTPYRKP